MPVPPKSAQNNAKRGLELRREWGRGGTEVGVARARDISNGSDLSMQTIKRMASFNRHRQNYNPDKKMPDGGPTAGTIAWLLWGGTTGIDWAINLSKGEKMKEGFDKKNIDHTKLCLEVKSISDDGGMTFSAYGSVTGVKDLVDDIIEQGAFKGVIENAISTGKYPKLLYQHDHKKVIGVITGLREDANGLLVEGRFIKTTLGKDAYTEVKEGAIDSMSIGFYVGEYSIDEKESIRKIKSIAELLEISFVTFPANPKANIVQVKQNDGIINVRILEKALRDVGLSQKEAKSLISGGISTIQRDAGLEIQIKKLESKLNAIKEALA